jgi:two-component sensor histidine kinase
MAAYFAGDHAKRLEMAGEPIRLTPKAALTLSMAMHELATNAVKYGALSNDAGCVRIEWNVVSDGRPAFRLRWSESDGPPVSVPDRRGFGSRLIEHGLAHDLAGEVRLDFRQQGLVCTIEAPLGEVAGGGVKNNEWLS